MNGILVAFTLHSGKDNKKSGAFTKALYGQGTSSHYGKYSYRRPGLLDDIPHRRLIRGVFFIRSENTEKVEEFLKEWGAEYHLRKVELSKEDEKIMDAGIV